MAGISLCDGEGDYKDDGRQRVLGFVFTQGEAFELTPWTEPEEEVEPEDGESWIGFSKRSGKAASSEPRVIAKRADMKEHKRVKDKSK